MAWLLSTSAYYVRELNGDLTELTECIQGAFSSSGGGGGVTQATQTSTLSSNFTTTNSSFTSSGLSVTLPNQTDGNSTIMAMGQWRNNDEDQNMELIFTNDDTEIDQTNMGYNGSAITGNPQMLGFFVATFATTDGSVIDLKVKTDGTGTALIASSATGRSSIIEKSLY